MSDSNCGDCGVHVRFLLLGEKEDGSRRWSPPLDLEFHEVVERKAKGAEPFEHQGYALTETFTIHNCQARVTREAEQRKDGQRRYARAVSTDEAWVVALERDCPRCFASGGSRCFNLTDVRLGAPTIRITRWPHTERLPPGWQEEQGR